MSVKKSPLTMAGALATVALLAFTAACGTAPAATTPQSETSASESSGESTTSGPISTPTPEAKPVVMSANVSDGASKVKVDTLVAVKASEGTLKGVKLTYKGTDAKGNKMRAKG